MADLAEVKVVAKAVVKALAVAEKGAATVEATVEG